MWQERCIPDKKRSLLLDRAVHEIQYGLQTLASDFQSVVAMSSARFGEPACHAVGEAAASVAPFPPLAALVAAVALCAEELC